VTWNIGKWRCEVTILEGWWRGEWWLSQWNFKYSNATSSIWGPKHLNKGGKLAFEIPAHGITLYIDRERQINSGAIDGGPLLYEEPSQIRLHTHTGRRTNVGYTASGPWLAGNHYSSSIHTGLEIQPVVLYLSGNCHSYVHTLRVTNRRR